MKTTKRNARRKQPVCLGLMTIRKDSYKTWLHDL